MPIITSNAAIYIIIRLLPFVFVLTSSSNLLAVDWFVATTSNAINYPPSQGMAESAPFRTISFALQYANPGDTIYVKAGIYGKDNDDYSENVQNRPTGFRDSDGFKVETADIRIIGYSGDYSSGNYALPTVPNSLGHFEFYEGYWDILFPTIEGVGGIGLNTAIGVEIIASDVEFSGFHVKSFGKGVRVHNAPDALVDQCILTNFGAPKGPGDPTTDGYVGIGASLSQSIDAVIQNCFLTDCEAEGFEISNGERMTIRNCQAYSRGYHENWNDTSGTLNTSLSDYTRRGLDYGFVILGSVPATNNVIEDCRTEFKFSQFADPPETKVYQGHGFGIVGADNEPIMEDNVIRDCSARAGGDGVVIRGQNTKDNTIESAEFDLTTYPINLVRGAHDNLFKRLIGHRICSVLATSGHAQGNVDIFNNRFLNCGFEFHSLAHVVQSISGLNYEIRDNLFCNCTFIATGSNTSGIGALNHPTVSAIDNEFVNCILHDFTSFKRGASTQTFECDFVNCNFFNTPFWINPSTQGATYLRCNDDDPGLVSTGPPPTSDFHLAPGALNAGAYEFNGAADRGTQYFELQQYLDPTLLLDIDIESGAYDPINTGSSVRYDIGCDEFYP